MADVEKIAAGNWRRVDIASPVSWTRDACWRWRDSAWIVALAFCPVHFSIGAEILNGFGKGLALYVGPFWIGIAASKLETDNG